MNDTPIFASVAHDLQISYDDLLSDAPVGTPATSAAQTAAPQTTAT